MKRKAVSEMLLLLLLSSMLTLAFDPKPVKAEWTGTVYIRADGSIDPPDAPIITYDNITYFLTDDITSSGDGIVIEKDNVTLDGTGHAIKGISSGRPGININGRENIIIKHVIVEGFSPCISLIGCKNCIIKGNDLTTNGTGIQLGWSFTSGTRNNTIYGNTIRSGGEHISPNCIGINVVDAYANIVKANEIVNMTYGIRLATSAYNNISDNTFINCGIFLPWYCSWYINHMKNNTVNGKPLVYLYGVSDYEVADAGQVILVNCFNITVKNLDLASYATVGIELVKTQNSTIINNIVANQRVGIYLCHSSNNTVSENKIENCISAGIEVWHGKIYYWSLHPSRSNNVISRNRVTNCSGNGIYLEYSTDNVIDGNSILNCATGIYTFHSHRAIVTNNDVEANYIGIYIYSSFNNVTRNNIRNNFYGIDISDSYGSSIFHNNFINNTIQVYMPWGGRYIWDNGYPSGGNYWSDYTGDDKYSGPNQDQPGSDGIGDTPYVIDADNMDHYPLIKPWAISGKTWTVDDDLLDYPDADFTRIQDAVNAATGGDTILVYPGNYSENVEVNKDHLTIKSVGGANVTIVHARSHERDVFQVSAAHVNIIGFTVRGASGIPFKAGISLYNTTGCHISDNYCLYNNVGIKLHYSMGNVITNNVADHNLNHGIVLSRSGSNILVNNKIRSNVGYGIYLWEDSSHMFTNNNKLINNTANFNSYGIFLYNSFDNLVQGNNLTSNNNDGIFVYVSNNNAFHNNIATSNYGNGIKLQSSENNLLNANLISNNHGYGIFRYHYSSNNTLINNTLSNNGVGACLIDSSENTIIQNSISNNSIGICLDHEWGQLGANENKIYTNNFLSNAIQAKIGFAFNNLWNSPEEIIYTYNSNTSTNYLGNYWSDYNGTDANGDGVGDTPYVVNSDTDDYPLVKPFENYILHPLENHPPTLPTTISQYKSDGATIIPEGETTQESTVIFKAIVSDPDGDYVRLEIELRQTSEAFTGEPTPETVSDFVPSGSEVTITRSGLVDASYHWRYRLRDSKGAATAWQEFGTPGYIDFKVSTPVSNMPPIASFDYSPKQPKAGEWIYFDASTSKDYDGKIEVYEWDLDNNGVYETSSSSPKIKCMWYKDGTYEIRLRVTDDKGGTNTTVKAINIKSSFTAKVSRFFKEIWPWGKKIKKIKDSDLALIYDELKLKDWLWQTDFWWVQPYDLKIALNQEIDPEKSPGLTYGILILNSIREKEMIQRTLSQEYKLALSEFFNNFIELNTGWTSLATDLTMKFLTGLLHEPYATGASTLWLAYKTSLVGVEIKALNKLWYYNTLWSYLDMRMSDETHEYAWENANSEPWAGNYLINCKNTEEYFKNLWNVYGDLISDTPPYRNEEPIIEKLRNLIIEALQKQRSKLPDRYEVIYGSPIEVRVYDSLGRSTGLFSGEIKEEIPYSAYDMENKVIVIFYPLDLYYEEIVGTGDGHYRLEVCNISRGETIIFTAIEIPTSTNAVHKYIIDWKVLSSGGEGVTVQVDSEGDGLFEHTFTSDSELTQTEYIIATDDTPPETSIFIGEPKFVVDNITYLTSATPILLIAEDNGSGVAITAYRIHNASYDTGWITYIQPFNLTGLSDGVYKIDYNSTDHAGNAEPTKTTVVVLDNRPPSTTITLGNPKYISDNIYVTSETPFMLEANDGEGAGIRSVVYRIYNETYNSGWLSYTEPFYLTGLADGMYMIEFNGTDNLGNVEAAKSIQVTLFSWNFIFTDSYGRGTTLKINVQHKFFQFITSDKDYGIKKASWMQAYHTTLLIYHKDDNLRLISIAIPKFDFCVTIAWDKETRTRYILIDKVGEY